MKKYLFKLLFVPVMFVTCTCLADNYVTIFNYTGCLENLDTLQVEVVKPVEIYAFTGTDLQPKYSGVSVAPGETKRVPMGLAKQVNPNQPALLLGTSPGDVVSHITVDIAPPNNTYAIIQVYHSIGSCTKNYPCVSEPLGGAAEKCGLLLASHRTKF